MIVSLEEAKNYLRIDYNEDDNFINTLIESSWVMCVEILREEPEEISEILKIAVLYSVAYLYEHREEADHGTLHKTLRALLSTFRKEMF